MMALVGWNIVLLVTIFGIGFIISSIIFFTSEGLECERNGVSQIVNSFYTISKSLRLEYYGTSFSICVGLSLFANLMSLPLFTYFATPQIKSGIYRTFFVSSLGLCLLCIFPTNLCEVPDFDFIAHLISAGLYFVTAFLHYSLILIGFVKLKEHSITGFFILAFGAVCAILFLVGMCFDSTKDFTSCYKAIFQEIRMVLQLNF